MDCSLVEPGGGHSPRLRRTAADRTQWRQGLGRQRRDIGARAECAEERPHSHGEPVVAAPHDRLRVVDVGPIVLDQQVEGLPVSPEVPVPQEDGVKPGQVADGRIALGATPPM